MQRGENVKQFCKITVHLNQRLPFAQHLGNGHWVISTQKNISLNIICQKDSTNSNHILIVRAPIQIIHLKNGCKGTSDQIRLPLHSELSSQANFEDPFDELIKLKKDKRGKIVESIQSRNT